MKAQEYRLLTDAELAKKFADLKAELFNLRFSNTTGSLQNPMAINVCKKEIAKAGTVIRERELGLSKAPAASSKATKKVAEKAVEEKEEAPAKKTVKATEKKETAKAAPKKEKADKILV